MTNGRRNELLSQFGPLAKSLTNSIVCSLQDQLRSIEKSSSPEILESVRVDVLGSTRFGVTNRQLTKRANVAKFTGLQTIDVKATFPKGNCRLELTSPSGPCLVLVEVKQAGDVHHYLRLVTTQPTDFVPVTAVKAVIVMTAIPLTIDALYNVLDELAPMLRRQEAGGVGSKVQCDDRDKAQEEAAAGRQQRQIEREARKMAKRRAWEAALQREILRRRLATAYKKLRVPAICASFAILLAVVAYSYWHILPDWAGKKAHDIEALASWNGASVIPAKFDREYYQLFLNETRTAFHYVAEWLEHVGLKNEQRREFFEKLRTEADSASAFLEWHFEPLTFPSDRHLTFKGDPRDVDKVTHLMLNAVDPLIFVWTMGPCLDTASWDNICALYWPLELNLADDTPAAYSFWKWWSLAVARELKAFYRFLEQNDFTWRHRAALIEGVGPTKDKVPYVRINFHL